MQNIYVKYQNASLMIIMVPYNFGKFVHTNNEYGPGNGKTHSRN